MFFFLPNGLGPLERIDGMLWTVCCTMYSMSMLPYSNHFPLDDSGVQLFHSADVTRPLELLRVYEEDGLLHSGVDLIIQGKHPRIQSNSAPAQVKGQILRARCVVCWVEQCPWTDRAQTASLMFPLKHTWIWHPPCKELQLQLLPQKNAPSLLSDRGPWSSEGEEGKRREDEVSWSGQTKLTSHWRK